MAKTPRKKRKVGSGRPTTYTNEQLIEILQKLAEELGRTPTAKSMQERKDLPSDSMYLRRFGSWKNAIKAAGLSMDDFNKQYTDRQLIENLQNIAEELGRTPTASDLLGREGPSNRAYSHRFGSWNDALEVAGLTENDTRKWYVTDEQLLKPLRELAKKLGHTPSLRESRDCKDTPSEPTYIRRFGSWSKAVEAAGLPKHKRSSG